MRTALIIFLMASAVLAQAQTGETRLAPSCGPDEVAFEVKTDKRSHPMGQAVAGKALVYFFEHDWYRGYSRPTTRLGVDGGWVGATSGNSYFYFSVDPGEHHICASWQIGVGAVGAARLLRPILRQRPEWCTTSRRRARRRGARVLRLALVCTQWIAIKASYCQASILSARFSRGSESLSPSSLPPATRSGVKSRGLILTASLFASEI